MTNARNITADQLTFGIEIECTIPYVVLQREGIRIGGHNSGPQIPGLPDGWIAMDDCSIRAGSSRSALEVVSPILQGADGLRQVVEVCEKLKEWDVRINRTTGLHIHVGTHNLGEDRLTRNPAMLKKVAALVMRNETALFASTGTKCREHGTYSRSGRAWLADNIDRLDFENAGVNRVGLGGRYVTMNLTALNRHGTIEFRVFQSTTNVAKLTTYIMMVLGLVCKAYSMKRRPKFNVQNADLQGTGGRVHQIVHDLCWLDYRGMAEKRYGRILTDVAIMAYRRAGETLGKLPTVAESMALLRRLGRKYDRDDTNETGHRRDSHRSI
jgi:hypothetical protein